MEQKLPEGFTDKVIERLRKVSKSREFAPPFEYAIVNGIYCGKNRQGCVIRMIKLKSCLRFAECSYGRKPDGEVREAIRELFNLAYDFGAVVRPAKEIGWIEKVADELGAVVGNTRAFARRVCSEASGPSPRLFYG
ncbi:hypothetical protein J4402_01240 [Candidatus Pacearchaeota archaeon]|nr:hypothetical protein [Candidatus Pacearchaeota archaeon]